MNRSAKHILLFEDDYQSMKDLKEHLEEALCWLVELTAAWPILDRLSCERFDLVVVDIMIHPRSLDADGKEVDNVHFPGVHWRKTGLEFVERLRRGEFAGQPGEGTPATVPLVILSAVADFPDKSWMPGAIDCWEKPFLLHELVARLESLVQE